MTGIDLDSWRSMCQRENWLLSSLEHKTFLWPFSHAKP